ncbi:MAG TPA: prolyl oligopeptidase family serine peptidase [Alphaproteobacteria bacterium]|nr:prolyl oligopeptidase family serine peptidase [Alphaproteobacteria bacterium]
MSDIFDLSGPSYGPASGGQPESLIVLLHGLGADGNDLIGLAPYWARALARTEFISPHAPFPCDMAPFGRQWFSLQDRSPAMVLAGVQAAAPILDAFIDQALASRGLDESRAALVGFSQGTMMSLYVAPRRNRAFAAVVGYSGAVIGGETLAAETRSRPPVLLIHGDADPVVPFQALAASTQTLRAAGLEVAAIERPGLGHSIDEDGLLRGGRFLAERLGGVA